MTLVCLIEIKLKCPNRCYWHCKLKMMVVIGIKVHLDLEVLDEVLDLEVHYMYAMA